MKQEQLKVALCGDEQCCESEVWVDVLGYEGFYKVSNKGAVKSMDRIVNHNYNGLATKRGKILTQSLTSKGYPCVGLTLDKKTKTLRTHRLVLSSFKGLDNDRPVVNHKNGIKTDNRLCNLEWNTMHENVLHAHSIGLVPKRILSDSEKLNLSIKGRKRVFCKKDGIVKSFESRIELSKYLGVKVYCVYSAINRGSMVHGYKIFDVETLKENCYE